MFFTKLLAKSIGTFWFVLGGCGSAVLVAALPDSGGGAGIVGGWATAQL